MAGWVLTRIPADDIMHPVAEKYMSMEEMDMVHSERGISVYQMIKKHLDEKDFHYEADDDRLVLKLIVHGEDLPQPTFIEVDDDRELMSVLSPIPSRIPEERRVDAAVAVSVANYGMITGGFDLDMSDGEIRFRVSQTFRGMEMSDEAIGYTLAITFITTDKYNDKFFMLGKGLMSLEQFIEQENAD